MTTLLVFLYAVGGALEVYGLVAVVRDVQHSQARAREIAQRPLAHYYGGAWISRPGKQMDPKDLERKVRVGRANQEHALKQIRDDLIDALVGNLGRRVRGLVALGAGLLIGVAANILSAFA